MARKRTFVAAAIGFIVFDAAAYDGAYRNRVGSSIRHQADAVSLSLWGGLNRA